MSAVTLPTLGPLGYIVPAQSTTLEQVSDDWSAALPNINTDPTTPQGQLIASETAIISDMFDQFQYYTTQTDPAYATGRMQDAIGRIYFLSRNPAQSTVVTCTCTGSGKTHIPTNALAQDTSGNTYYCTSGGTIGNSGTITLEFANTITGPIPCPEGTLTTIYRSIPGWSTITNPGNGVLGNNVETRAAFEARREAAVAGNSFGSIASIIGNILQTVPGVLDWWGYDNGTASPVTQGGVSVPAHSIYISIFGGSAAAIAFAIWQKKAPGCGYGGNTTQTVTDPSPIWNPPAPTYSVTFETPGTVAIYYNVTLANTAAVPANALALIQAAIVTAFSGADGGPRMRMASVLYASRMYTPVALLGTWAQIITIQVGCDNTTAASFTGVIAGTALTVSSVTGTIAAGQWLEDTSGHLLPGTMIVSGSGSSWVVNLTQTVSSEAMVAVAALSNDVTMTAAQEPTIIAGNVNLILV